jgi:phosphoglycolate phosphatase-like HAD superfamily hydrolase
MSRSITEALVARIERALAAGYEPLVVFDLDGTLYDNAPRTLRILQEFAHLHPLRHADLLRRVSSLAAAGVRYRVSDTLASVGVTDPAEVAAAEAFWAERFFTNEYVVHDLPLAGAVEFVRHVHALGGVPVYLTGRDAPNMLVGTVKALQRDGFPVGTCDNRLITKGDFAREDHAFKADVIAHLRRVGRVVGAFDNEPGLCNLFREAFEDAVVVWLDTSFAPGAPALRSDVLPVADFSALLSDPDFPE